MSNTYINGNLNEMDRQMEKASLFTHTVLSEQITRLNETDAFLYGLIDYLIQKGVVLPEELQEVVSQVKRELIEKKDYATLGAVIRIDSEEEDIPYEPVNCDERIHICKAICCKLSFALSSEEIELGVIKWDLGKPYQIRHKINGYCSHINDNSKCCSVYSSRPSVCRTYSCSKDKRIWTDFENMELNQEWIDHNIETEKPVMKSFITAT